MAYDLLLRRLTPANWARRSTLPVTGDKNSPDAAIIRAAQEHASFFCSLKARASKGDKAAAKKLGEQQVLLRDMKLRAAGGYPDSSYCQKFMTAMATEGIVVSGWPRKSISCGVGRSPHTVKGEIVNGRGISDNGRFVSLMGQGRGFTMWGDPADPLAQLPTKERKTVAQLILLRKRADEGDTSAQRVVEAVARLKIFVPPSSEPAKL
jgi:hypothetical protein